MNIIHNVKTLPRLVDAARAARLRVMPAVVLTGSANLLLMRQVSESLAGRASYLTLWSMTRRQRGAYTLDQA